MASCGQGCFLHKGEASHNHTDCEIGSRPLLRKRPSPATPAGHRSSPLWLPEGFTREGHSVTRLGGRQEPQLLSLLGSGEVGASFGEGQDPAWGEPHSGVQTDMKGEGGDVEGICVSQRQWSPEPISLRLWVCPGRGSPGLWGREAQGTGSIQKHP